MSVELTIVLDNARCRDDLHAEHGLSVLLRGEDDSVLFDVGASPDALSHNAASLGVDLTDLHGAVLSHGHYDHTGGLGALFGGEDPLPVYAHPGVFRRRWRDSPGKPLRDISCPYSPRGLREGGLELHPIEAPQMLAEWLILSGPVGGPRCQRESFVVLKDGQMLDDTFEDELFCLLRGDNGWAVLTGCCHRGLGNTLRAARFLTHGDPIVAIVGGLHLRSAGEKELASVARLVQATGAHVYPCHCTGDAATDYLADALPGRITPVTGGANVQL